MDYLWAFVIMIVLFIVPAAIVTGMVAQPGRESPTTRATEPPAGPGASSVGH